jgi:hypothetical protein
VATASFLDLEAADRHDATLQEKDEPATAEDMAFANNFKPSQGQQMGAVGWVGAKAEDRKASSKRSEREDAEIAASGAVVEGKRARTSTSFFVTSRLRLSQLPDENEEEEAGMGESAQVFGTLPDWAERLSNA